jgi:hypothetical protein
MHGYTEHDAGEEPALPAVHGVRLVAAGGVLAHYGRGHLDTLQRRERRYPTLFQKPYAIFTDFLQEEWRQYLGDEPYHKTCPNVD